MAVVKQVKVITKLNDGSGGGGSTDNIYTVDDQIVDTVREVKLAAAGTLKFVTEHGETVLKVKQASGTNTAGNIINNNAIDTGATNSLVGGDASSAVRGRNCIAWGEGADTTGPYSAAFGVGTIGPGGYGALGFGNYYNITAGAGCLGGGQGNTLSGLSSAAVNANNTVSGNLSSAFNLQNNVSAGSSTCTGYANTMAGVYNFNGGGQGNTFSANSQHCAIIGSFSSDVLGFTSRSVVAGGNNIQADTNDTLFCPVVAIKAPYTPTSTADTQGSEGTIVFDDNFIYVKTSAGWKRSALVVF